MIVTHALLTQFATWLALGCGNGTFTDLGLAPTLPPSRAYSGGITAFITPNALSAYAFARKRLAAAAFPTDLVTRLPITSLALTSDLPPLRVGGDGSEIRLRVLGAQLVPLNPDAPPTLRLTLAVLPGALPALSAAAGCHISLTGAEVTLLIPLALGRDVVGRILVTPTMAGATILDPVGAHAVDCGAGELQGPLDAAIRQRLETAFVDDTPFVAAATAVATRLLGASLPSHFAVEWPDGAAIDATITSASDSSGEPIVVTTDGTAVIPLTVSMTVAPSPCAAEWAPPLPAPALEAPYQPAEPAEPGDVTLAFREDVVAAFASAALAAGAWCAVSPEGIGSVETLASRLAAAGVAPATLAAMAPSTPLVARWVPTATPTSRFDADGTLTLSFPTTELEVFARSDDLDTLLFRTSAPAELLGLGPTVDGLGVVRLTGGSITFGDAAESPLAEAVIRAILNRSPLLVLPDRLALPISAATLVATSNYWLAHLTLSRTAQPTWGQTAGAVAGPDGPAAGCSLNRRGRRAPSWLATALLGLGLVALVSRRRIRRSFGAPGSSMKTEVPKE